MSWKTLPEVLADKDPHLLLEKQGGSLVYRVRECEMSYELDDRNGGTYFVGKMAGSIALLPIWRKHIKISRG